MKKKLFTTKELTLTALLAAIICILGPIALPISISPVPISLGTLAIYFVVAVSNFKIGFVSVILYLLIGLVGVPVFASYTAGVGKLMGPTGGYLIGFIFIALTYGVSTKFIKNYLIASIVGILLGTAVCYLFGTLWLGFQLEKTFAQALMIGVIPYLPGDFAKLVLALLLALPIRSRLQKANLL